MGSMMRSEATLLLLTLMAVSRPSATVAGAVYKVGDDAAWNVGGVDYQQWTFTKTFRVGDILVFQYTPQAHNVLRVSLNDYHSCNTTTPIATYTSGYDSITIMGPGHYYYICGIPGHCKGGQKVDIRVLKVPQPTELPNGGPAQSPHHIAPTPSPIYRVAPAPSPINDTSPTGPSQSGDLGLAYFRRHGLRDLVLLFVLSIFII